MALFYIGQFGLNGFLAHQKIHCVNLSFGHDQQVLAIVNSNIPHHRTLRKPNLLMVIARYKGIQADWILQAYDTVGRLDGRLQEVFGNTGLKLELQFKN